MNKDAITDIQLKRLKRKLRPGRQEDWLLVAGYDFQFEPADKGSQVDTKRMWVSGKLALRHVKGQTYLSTDPWRTELAGPLLRSLIERLEQTQDKLFTAGVDRESQRRKKFRAYDENERLRTLARAISYDERCPSSLAAEIDQELERIDEE